MLRGGIGGSREKFDAYYNEYIFPEWTIPRNYPKLPKLRKALQTDFSTAQNPESYSHLLELSLNNLTKLATTPDFDPAVRFNAAFMLGGLNRTASQRNVPPVAYAKSLPVLVQLLEDDNENDAVRFGALLGVVRHAKFNVDEASRPVIIDALIKQASLVQPPAGRPDDGHEWFRSKAIEGVSFAKGAEIGKVIPVLTKIVNSPVESDAVRRAAAASLGGLPLTPDSEISVSPIVRSLAKLATDAVREQVEACEKDMTKTIDPIDLKDKLLPIRIALTGEEKSVNSPTRGLAAAAKEEKDQKFLKNVWKPIEEWYGKLDKKELMSDESKPTTGTGDPLMMGGTTGSRIMSSDQQTEARAATEELIEYFNRELKKMENLLGGTK